MASKVVSASSSGEPPKPTVRSHCDCSQDRQPCKSLSQTLEFLSCEVCLYSTKKSGILGVPPLLPPEVWSEESKGDILSGQGAGIFHLMKSAGIKPAQQRPEPVWQKHYC